MSEKVTTREAIASKKSVFLEANLTRVKFLFLQAHSALPDTGILTGGPLVGSYQFLKAHFHWGSVPGVGSEHTIDRIR